MAAATVVTIAVASVLALSADPIAATVSDAPPTPYPPRVTLITDSVGGVLFWVTAARDELGRGLDFHLETKTCRKLVSAGCYSYGEVPPSVLETVQTLGHDLGYLVVVDVGYNDFAEDYDKGLDAVMGALAAAGVERVVWVTLHEGQGTWAEINAQIRAARARWPQLTVADWAPVSAGEPSWFVDAAHMNDVGATGFVHFLRPVVLDACGAACVPPEATATMLVPAVRAHQATLRWSGNSFATAYDVGVRREGGAWRTVATQLKAMSFRVHGVPGAKMQARIRARDVDGIAGRWSEPRPFRL